jgi:hypothetical protein
MERRGVARSQGNASSKLLGQLPGEAERLQVVPTGSNVSMAQAISMRRV